MTVRHEFGRRGKFGERAPASSGAPPAESGPLEQVDDLRSDIKKRAEEAQQLRGLVKKMLFLIPPIVALPALFVVMTKHLPTTSDASTGGSSASGSCHAQAAAGTIFDIDWCRAGAAALRGAAQGVALGAGRR